MKFQKLIDKIKRLNKKKVSSNSIIIINDENGDFVRLELSGWKETEENAIKWHVRYFGYFIQRCLRINGYHF